MFVRCDSMDSAASVYCTRYEEILSALIALRLVGALVFIVQRRRSRRSRATRPADHRTADRHSPSVEPGVVARRTPRRVSVGARRHRQHFCRRRHRLDRRRRGARALTRYADGQGGGSSGAPTASACTSRGRAISGRSPLGGGEPSAVWSTPQAENGITPSPDGTRVAFVRSARRRRPAPAAAGGGGRGGAAAAAAAT